RPSKLWEEADPDWSPTLLLGYSSKHGDPARHDRSVRRRFQKEAAQAKRRAEAAATESTIRDSPGVVAASPVSSLPVEDEVGIEDGETGDVVLADRGFNVSESVGFYCAKLHVPAFTKGKKQLSAADVLSTRKLANVRIHVERVIGLIRNKYVILKATLPIDYVISRQGDNLTPLDKIVNVCCGLSNLCPSIVALQKQDEES
ncbi:hypothetical protein MTO96_044256, partial [Rhipicephalus appendiculatus]